MSCDCEYPDFYTNKIVKARKHHRCCECNRSIDVGSKYQNYTGKWDGEIERYKTCFQCAEVRSWVHTIADCCIAFGDLYQELRELDILVRDQTKTVIVDCEYEGQIEIIDGFVRFIDRSAV